MTLERLSSGSAELDAILGGGLPANGITLIVGVPGTGKTMLAEQYAFHNATPERPAVYCATASEPFAKIVHYGQTLTFFDAGAIGKRVLFENLGEALADGGLDAVLVRLEEIVREHRPGLLFIDSFKALAAFAGEEVDFRRFVSAVAGLLTAFPANAFWVGEYGAEDLARAPEFAIADSIISLETRETGLREARGLRVLKLRGSSFLSGHHAYRLSADGLRVFPRIADPGDTRSYGAGRDRASTGVDGLDRMLEGGIPARSSTLVAGPSGSGKTTLGLQFLAAGGRRGEPGLLATLQEHPTTLQPLIDALSDDGAVRPEVLYRSPVDVYIDEWAYELVREIERLGIRRVVIDSVNDLRLAADDEIRLQEHIYSLVHRCARAGVSLMLTLETVDMTGGPGISMQAISHMSDNVLLLRNRLDGERLERSLAVLKTRGSGHDPAIRGFEISGKGISLTS